MILSQESNMHNISTMHQLKKVLLITYDFYPDSSPNTYRWFNLAKEWQSQGVEVFVIAANKSQFPAYEEINGIKIFRTGEYAAGSLKYKFNSENTSGISIANQRASKGLKSGVRSLIRKLYDLTWSKLYWPDYAFLWKFTAFPVAVDLIKSENIDKLVTVSWMFSAHMIGLKLKRKFGAGLFWLADTVDPFSFNSKINNTSLYLNKNLRIEKSVFLNADLNSVLTERIKVEYMTRFPAARDKIFVNKNLFLPVDFDYTKPKEIGKGIRLVFLGTLSEETRSPRNLLALIDLLSKERADIKFDVSFFGSITDCYNTFLEYEHLLDNIVFLCGRKNKDEINLILKDADVLINIGNSNPYQEPSKIIEYMYSGKKILNVCTIKDDTSAHLLKIYPLHLNVFPDELEDIITIQKVVNFLNSDVLIARDQINELLKDHFLKSVSDKYYQHIFQ